MPRHAVKPRVEAPELAPGGFFLTLAGSLVISAAAWIALIAVAA